MSVSAAIKLKEHSKSERTREQKAHLLPLREDNPRRIEERRKDLSGIFDGHSGEGGNGCGEVGAHLGSRILAANESDDESKADEYSDDNAEKESHNQASSENEA